MIRDNNHIKNIQNVSRCVIPLIDCLTKIAASRTIILDLKFFFNFCRKMFDLILTCKYISHYVMFYILSFVFIALTHTLV